MATGALFPITSHSLCTRGSETRGEIGDNVPESCTQGHPQGRVAVVCDRRGKGRTVTKLRQSRQFGRQKVGPARCRSWRSRLGLVAAIVTIGAPVALVSGSTPALAAARVVDGLAEVIPGTTVLSGVACHGHDNCVAVGSDGSGEGVVVPITDGIPGAVETVAGTDALTSVSCPTTTFCLAVGYGPYTLPPNRMATEGVVVGISDGVPGGINTVIGPGQIGVPDSVFLYGVACSSANSCLVGGSDTYLAGVVVRIKPDNVGNEIPVSAYVVSAVACRRPSFCIAVGQALFGGGAVIFISYGKTTNEGGPTGAGGLDAVSCRSTQWCLAGGANMQGTEGVVALIVSKSLRDAEGVSGTSSINGVACRATTVDCLAVGDNSSSQGVVAGIYDGTPGVAQAVTGTEGLNGVACPSNTTCLVVGNNGSNQGVLAMIDLPPR